MNAKSKLMVKYSKGIIEMNTTFAKMMQNPLSDEYALLQRTRLDFPEFKVCTRQIKSNPKKDTYKGLTYEWMRNHIATHEAEAVVEQKLKDFDEMVYISKCHRGSLRYPTIKKWFLDKYPEVAKFGMVNEEEAKSEEAKDEEANSQNAIPLPAAKTSDEAATAEAKKVS